MPDRLIAVRCPATASACFCPCTCTPRTVTPRPPGAIARSVSAATRPDTSVPVTTVPKPFIENTRSIGRRAAPAALRVPAWPLASASAARSVSRPSPVFAETGTIAAPSRKEPAISSRTSMRASSSISASTRSTLVSATIPAGTRSSRQMSKCSRVCGITDFVRGDNQHDEIDPAGPGQHVLDEPFVPRDVDERDVDAGDGLMGEAEVDGDAAGFLLLEPIGIGARQGADQRALAVIDVTGGADDYGTNTDHG